MNASCGIHSNNVLVHFSENLNLVKRQLSESKHERPVDGIFSRELFWNKLGAAFNTVSVEATKLSMILSKPPRPSADVCAPLVSRVEGACLVLVSAFYGLPKSQGVTLHKYVHQAVIDVVNSLLSLSAAFNDTSLGSASQLQSTGCLWESTDAFAALPKDNKMAAVVTVHNASGLVSDAMDELNEALESSDSPEDDVLRDVIADGNDDDNNISPESVWSARDREIVLVSAGLIKVAKSYLKKTSQAIEKNGSCEAEAHIAQFDSLSELVDRISPNVDDLIMPLYPPVNYHLLQQQVELLAGHLNSALNCIRYSHMTAESDASWVDFLLKATEHNFCKINELLKDVT